MSSNYVEGTLSKTTQIKTNALNAMNNCILVWLESVNHPKLKESFTKHIIILTNRIIVK